jgi:very-short-patch-repair endonuclease
MMVGLVGCAMVKSRARVLRRQMSPAEAALWVVLRQEPLARWHFRRQLPLGPYHADFGSHAARLVIEVDGSQHFGDAAQAQDAQRNRFFAGAGYGVLRVTTSEVLGGIEGVVAAVLARLPG